jgi:hypothetical protein
MRKRKPPFQFPRLNLFLTFPQYNTAYSKCIIYPGDYEFPQLLEKPDVHCQTRKQWHTYIGFGFFTAVTIKNVVFWDVFVL